MHRFQPARTGTALAPCLLPNPHLAIMGWHQCLRLQSWGSYTHAVLMRSSHAHPHIPQDRAPSAKASWWWGSVLAAASLPVSAVLLLPERCLSRV